MAEHLFIRDTITGRTLQVIRQSPNQDYLVIEDCLEAEEVKKASVRKVIRTWMGEVKSDNP